MQRETQKTMGREAAKGITVAQGNGSSRSGQQDGMWVPSIPIFSSFLIMPQNSFIDLNPNIPHSYYLPNAILLGLRNTVVI